MSTMTRTATVSRDRLRQSIVAVSALVAIVGDFIGAGIVVGTPINQAAGGALAADATLIAPGTGAFQIWGVIYLGLVAYAVWQFLPAQTESERQRRLGYPVALSMLLNAAWILSIQFDMLWLSIPVIAALLVVLVVAFLRARAVAPTGRLDALVTDGTIGLYLGWVAVATAANVTAGLQAAGFDGWGLPTTLWSVVVVAVAAAVGVALAVRGAGRIAPALSLAWGLAWIAEARLGGQPHSVATGVAAILGTLLVLAVTVVARRNAAETRRISR